LVGLVITATAWFVWLHRAVSNAWALGRPTEFTPAWSVGWWFVPFANLVRPYQIVRSLEDELGAWSNAPVFWWWVSYIAGGIVSELGLFIRPTDLAGFRAFVGVFLIADVLRIVAGALAIWLIAELDLRAEVMAREQATAPSSPPEPSASAMS
jgi:hypothetical protein